MRGGNPADSQVKTGQALLQQERILNLYRQSGGTFAPRNPVDILRPGGAGLIPTNNYAMARAMDQYAGANPSAYNPPVYERNLRALEKAKAEQAEQERMQAMRDRDEEDELRYKQETRAFGRDMLARQRKMLSGGGGGGGGLPSTGGSYGVSGL